MKMAKLVIMGLVAVGVYAYKIYHDNKEEREEALQDIENRADEDEVTLGNSDLQTQDERVKAKQILDAKKNDIRMAVTRKQIEKAKKEYWHSRGFFDQIEEDDPMREDKILAMQMFIAYEWGKIERREKLRQEELELAKMRMKFDGWESVVRAGKPALNIVNNIAKEMKEEVANEDSNR